MAWLFSGHVLAGRDSKAAAAFGRGFVSLTGWAELVLNLRTGEFIPAEPVGFWTSGFRYSIGPYLGYRVVPKFYTLWKS